MRQGTISQISGASHPTQKRSDFLFGQFCYIRSWRTGAIIRDSEHFQHRLGTLEKQKKRLMLAMWLKNVFLGYRTVRLIVRYS